LPRTAVFRTLRLEDGFFIALFQASTDVEAFLFQLMENRMPNQLWQEELQAATGESRRTLRRYGFQLLQPEDDSLDDEPEVPQVFDWDSHAACSLAKVA
jgi:hypothetical protein